LNKQRWFHGLALLVLTAAAGCAARTERLFTVTSIPPGAKIYVDGEFRGTTDEARLAVVFPHRRPVTLRLEKDKYQTTGMVLHPESSSKLPFFLAEAPKNDEILESLQNIERLLGNMRNIERHLNRIQNQLDRPEEPSD